MSDSRSKFPFHRPAAKPVVALGAAASTGRRTTARRLLGWRRAATLGATGVAVAGWSLFNWFAPQTASGWKPWSIAPVAAQQSMESHGPGKPPAGEFDFVARPARRFVSDPNVRPAAGSIPTFDREPSDAELAAGLGEDVGGNGIQARFGQFTVSDDSIAAPESLTFVEMMPYTIAGNTMLLGDVRLYRAMNANLGGTAGLGIRQYLPGWNRVIGVSGFYDLDDTRDIEFQQLSLGLELLGENWDLRANGYMPIDDTVVSGNQRVQEGSERFSGNQLLFTQLTDVSASTKGVDMLGTIPLRGAPWMEKINLEASGGWYHFQAPDAETEKVWGGRVRLDAGFLGELVHTSVDITTDAVFDTNLMFTASIDYHNGMNALRKRGSQKNRFAEWHRRNWTVTAITETVADDALPAINPDDGQAYRFLHVANNGLNTGGVAYPDFDPGADLGTFENPYQSLEDALFVAAADAGGFGGNEVDVIYTGAGSVFEGTDFVGPIVLPSGTRLLGEGFVTDGPGLREVVNTLPLDGFSLVAELPTPTIDAIEDPATRADFIAALGTEFPERPILRNLTAGDYGVQFSDRTEFSGFRIENSLNPLGALYATTVVNGATRDNGFELGALSQDVSVLGAAGKGFFFDNVTGVQDVTNLRIGQINTSPFATTGATPVAVASGSLIFNSVEDIGVHIDGGTPNLTFFSDSNATLTTGTSLIAKTDTSIGGGTRNSAVLIENTSALSFIDFSDTFVVDGTGLEDVNNDGLFNDADDITGDGLLTFADLQEGGLGVLVGTDTLGTAATTFGTINLGAITTGLGPVGNTAGSGLAVSEFGGTLAMRGAVNIDSAGADPGGANPDLNAASLRFSDIAPTATIFSIASDAPITITNRNATGIEFRRVNEGDLTGPFLGTDINFLSPVTVNGTNDGAVAIFDPAVNFQNNGADIAFSTLDIDNQDTAAAPGGAGINIGVRDIVGSPGLQNLPTASFTVADLSIEGAGALQSILAPELGFAAFQVLNDPTAVQVSSAAIIDRVGFGYEIFQTTGSIGMGAATIDDNGDDTISNTAVTIREIADSVTFTSLNVVANESTPIRADSILVNPFERAATDLNVDFFTQLPNLEGYNVIGAVVDVRNNTLGGSNSAGASVDLGALSVDTDGGTALYAIDNRRLQIDGGTINVTSPIADTGVYIANAFDLDVRFDVFNFTGADNDVGFRVINAGLPGEGATVAIDPLIDTIGAGGDMSSTGNTRDRIGVYLTDIDGSFTVRGVEIEGFDRGIYVENRFPGEALDFVRDETFPSLADATADSSLDLFDVSGSANTVTRGEILFTQVADSDQEGIRLRNVQSANLEGLDVDQNGGFDSADADDFGGDQQIVIEIFDTDDNAESQFFDYVLRDSVVTSDGVVEGDDDLRHGLFDVLATTSAEQSTLRIDAFNNIFTMDDDFASAIDIKFGGLLTSNPTTNLGFDGNIIVGNDSGDQNGIFIEQRNDDILDTSFVSITNNTVDLGLGDDQVAFLIDFESPISLAITENQEDMGIVGPGGGIVMSGTNATGIELNLEGTGNAVLIENNTFDFNEIGLTVYRGVRITDIGGPSTLTIQGNTFDFANGNFFDGFNDIVVDIESVTRDELLPGTQVSLFSGTLNTVVNDDTDAPTFLDIGINDLDDFFGQLLFNDTFLP